MSPFFGPPFSVFVHLPLGTVGSYPPASRWTSDPQSDSSTAQSFPSSLHWAVLVGVFFHPLLANHTTPFPPILIRPGFCLSNPTRSFCPYLKCSRKFKKSQAWKVLFWLPGYLPDLPDLPGWTSTLLGQTVVVVFSAVLQLLPWRRRTSAYRTVVVVLVETVVCSATNLWKRCCCFFPRCSPSLNLSFLF